MASKKQKSAPVEPVARSEPPLPALPGLTLPKPYSSMTDDEKRAVQDALAASITDEQLLALDDARLAVEARGRGPDALYAYALLVFNLRPAEHHKAWIEAIFHNSRVAITAPPESAKTTWGIILVSYWMGRYPLATNLVVSSGEGLASDIAESVIYTIEFNDKWKLCFPSVVPDKSRGWSREGWWVRDTSLSDADWAKRIGARKDPSLAFGGVGSASVNGKRITGLAIADDLHDRKSRTSAAICKEVVDFVKDTFLRRVTVRGRTVFFQTRWNPLDSIGYLASVGVKVFTHPALLADGSSYWPDQWPVSRLEGERRLITDVEWKLVFMCDADAARGILLKLEALRDFPHLHIVAKWQRYIGVDFAQKLQELSPRDEAKHSHFALAVMAYTGTHLVLEDGYDDLIAMGEAEETFFTFAERIRPVRSAVEVNAQNRLYYNNLMRRKIERGLAWLSVVPITTTKNKGTRMSEMEPDFRNGAIMVSDAPLAFLKVFRDQWVGFGTDPLNDTLDATYLVRLAAYNLLPRDTPDEQHRKRYAKPSLTTSRAIESAYT